jgi:hypothetical protein
MLRPILLGLSAAIAAGLLFVNLYNSIVDAPNWGADIPNSIMAARNYFSTANPGNFFRVFSPANQVLALIAVILCWKNNRYLALASLGVAIVLDVMTFAYFYPRNEIMFIATLDENAVRTAWQEWSSMNWIRSTLCAVNTTLAFTLLISNSKKITA